MKRTISRKHIVETPDARKARNWLLDEQAGKHTVTVGMAYANGKKAQATGVCITFHGEYFVVTAAHVLKPTPEKLFFVPKPEGSYVYHAPATARSHGFEPSIVEILPPKNPKDDVAVLRLSQRPKELSEAAFYFTGLSVPKPLPPGKQVVLLGHPGALTIRHRRGGEIVPEARAMSDAPRIMRVPRNSPLRKTGKYSDALHFALDFPELRGSDVSDPEGLSGAGVWLPFLVRQAPYQTEMRLVGIQIKWLRSARLLVVTRIRRVWLILEAWSRSHARSNDVRPHNTAGT